MTSGVGFRIIQDGVGKCAHGRQTKPDWLLIDKIRKRGGASVPFSIIKSF